MTMDVTKTSAVNDEVGESTMVYDYRARAS